MSGVSNEETIIVHAGEASFSVSADPSRSVLAVLASSSRVFVPAACGGRGTCGTCRVEVLRGDPEYATRGAPTAGAPTRSDPTRGGKPPEAGSVPVSAADRRFLSAEHITAGIRLACRLPSTAVRELSIPRSSDRAFTKTDLPEITGPIDPLVYTRRLDGEASVTDQRALLSRAGDSGTAGAIDTPALEVLRQLATAGMDAELLYADDGGSADRDAADGGSAEGDAAQARSPAFIGIVPDVPRGDTGGPLGVAVDIGTTTLGCYLVDLSADPSQRVPAARAAMNRQAVFGADVLSRISHADEGGLEELRRAIVTELDEVIVKLLDRSGRSAAQVAGITLAGNTTMLHLLLGVDPQGIGRAPFIPVFTGAMRFSGASVGLESCPRAAVWLLPAVSAYVGADTVSAAVAEDLDHTTASVLMIDVGTNGELVLVHDGDLFACSTAAGPAFEGATISHGVGGIPGAVTSWSREGAEFRWTTLSSLPAVGLAGSALLDVAAQLLDDGVLEETGRMIGPEELADLADPALREAYQAALKRGGEGEPELEPAPGIRVTQGDVRELQLAKAAIAAGIDVLLDRAGMTAEHLDRVILTGGFGQHLAVSSALRIGLLPGVPESRVTTAANAAGVGAVRALLQREILPRMRAVAATAEHIELSALPSFQDRYIDHMIFPDISRSHDSKPQSDGRHG